MLNSHWPRTGIADAGYSSIRGIRGSLPFDSVIRLPRRSLGEGGYLLVLIRLPRRSLARRRVVTSYTPALRVTLAGASLPLLPRSPAYLRVSRGER